MDEGKKAGRLTRRRFLKGAAAGVAGAGAAVLMGRGRSRAQAAEAPAQWDAAADVIVVGSGPAGLPAAVAAAEKGAAVIVLEQNREVGGNGIISGGILSIGGGTPVQKALGVEDSADIMYREGIDCRVPENKRNDPELLRAFCDYNLSTYAWLESYGVRFQKTLLDFPGRNSTPRTHLIYWDQDSPGWLYRYGPEPSSGAGLIRPLEAAARRQGVKILLGHAMRAIIREKGRSGRVLGLEVEAEGRRFTMKAGKGVVIGSGGWKGHRWLRRLFDPRLTEDLAGSGEPFVQADGMGIVAALEAGAALATDRAIDKYLYHRMFGTRYYRFPTASPHAAPGLGPSGQLSQTEAAELILVNKGGKRYVDEALPEKPPVFYDLSLAQEDHVIWALFDQAAAERNGWDPRPPLVQEGYAFSAATLEALAGKLGLSAGSLAETVGRYNSFVEKGEDPECGKPAVYLKYKMEKEPFHAVRMSIQVHDTAGGLAVNARSQVMDNYGQVIPGLYAAGEAAGGLDKIGMPRGIVMGRIAGEHVV